MAYVFNEKIHEKKCLISDGLGLRNPLHYNHSETRQIQTKTAMIHES